MSQLPLIDPDLRTRKKRRQKKAPEAPKKALTAYIFFNKEMRPKVKETLGPEAKTTEIVRVIANKWNSMSEEEKAPYIKLAEDDKVRYNEEITRYDGPLHIPVSRKRGRHSRPVDAPKRAMSPFLFFSNEKRQEMQQNNPDMRMTEITSKLGEMWREMSDEAKQPYVEKSKEARERYHKEQEVYKSKTPQPMPTSTSSVVPSSLPVVTANQWSVPMNENTGNAIYGRPFEISSASNSFTNISIPTGFGSIVQ